MKSSIQRRTKSLTVNHARPARISFGIACTALASACSGYYPLGQASQKELPVGTDVVTASAASTQSPALATAAFSLDGGYALLSPGWLGSLGDLDGDGKDDLATTTYYPSTTTDYPSPSHSYLHIRYGSDVPGNESDVTEFDRGGARLLGPKLGDYDDSVWVARAGDVDGDGYADFLVQTWQCGRLLPGMGTYLVYGGPERLEGTLAIADLGAYFVPPEPPFDARLNRDSCTNGPPSIGVGDLDGDGLDDLVLGVDPLQLSYDQSSGFGVGEGLYVFYGRKQRFSGELPYASADAWLHVDASTTTVAAGDVNGDGLADVLIEQGSYGVPYEGRSFFLAGQRSRWRGTVELSDVATALEGAHPPSNPYSPPEDLDGDGLADVLLGDEAGSPHLFYGSPGLFATGVHFEDSVLLAGKTSGEVQLVGDRNGDGKAELIASLYATHGPLASYPMRTDVVVVAGSAERLSGSVTWPESEVLAQHPAGLYGNALEAIEDCIPAGDLDGDGTQDLLTVSQAYAEGTPSDANGLTSVGAQMHVHYGAPGGASEVNSVR